MLVIQPFTWLFRFVGVGFTSHRSSLDKLILSVVLFVFFPLCTLSIKDKASAANSDSMEQILHITSRCSHFLGFVGFFLYNCLFSESYSSILRDLKDSETKLLGIGAKPRQNIFQQLVGLFILFLLILVKTLISFLNCTSVLVSLGDICLFVLFAASHTQFLVLVGILSSFFSALNDQLIEFSRGVDETSVDVVSSQLESVFRIHTRLHVTVNDLNGHFFIFNFLATTSRLMIILTTMYSYLLSITEDSSFDSFQVLGIVVNSVYFVFQCVVCHACAKEANRTVLLAHHSLQPHTALRLWLEVGDFSQLCLDNKVSFSVGGMFTLERPLITKVMVLALSYLIVAVQLKDVQFFGSNSALTNFTSNVTAFENTSQFGNLSF